MPFTTAVVLLAAGSSRRFGSPTPKQFFTLSSGPLFMKSLRVFLDVPFVDEVVLVVRVRDKPRVERGISKLRTKKRLYIVEGGRFRGESVRNGVMALRERPDVVLVHDSARPLVTKDIVVRVAEAAAKSGVALAAAPLPDTLKRSKGLFVRKTIPRDRLWLAQTPQGFRLAIAKECLLRPKRGVTDDVQLAEQKGYRVKIVEGSMTNFKVTFPKDLETCRRLAR
jgi:2-C-methyl-D-erythritol 4-phosphate cytidylyltransferase